MVHRIEDGNGLAVHVDCVRHVHLGAERAADAFRDDGLAVAGRAVEEQRLAGVHRGPEQVLHRVVHDEPFAHRVDPRLLVPNRRADLRRLGSAHDGGYVVALETIAEARHLLSFGLAANWDFERDAVALNRELTLEAFDPSVGPRHFAGMAVRSLRAADEAGLVEVDTILDVGAIVLGRREKALVKSQSTWLRQAAKRHPEEAAKIYNKHEPQKGGIPSILKMMDPNGPDELQFHSAPAAFEAFADFMHKSGMLKTKANSWKDFFFERAWSKSGS